MRKASWFASDQELMDAQIFRIAAIACEPSVDAEHFVADREILDVTSHRVDRAAEIAAQDDGKRRGNTPIPP